MPKAKLSGASAIQMGTITVTFLMCGSKITVYDMPPFIGSRIWHTPIGPQLTPLKPGIGASLS